MVRCDVHRRNSIINSIYPASCVCKIFDNLKFQDKKRQEYNQNSGLP